MCGDFNIDLLNPRKLKAVDHFNMTMGSMRFIPMISKSTRITRESSTLIDNIYSNELAGKSVSGIIISDFSDHLPIFNAEGPSGREHGAAKANTEVLRSKRWYRSKTKEGVAKMREELQGEEWKEVYSTKDVNEAYETFLNKFMQSYNKSCPMTCPDMSQ